MRRLIALLTLAALAVVGGAPTVHAAPSAPSGTIVLNESGPFTLDDTVTFSTTVSGLKGNQWPMVYLVCYSDLDGGLLVGQLDHPDADFLIGGGWSPWRDPENAGEDGTCIGRLYAYSKQGDITFLAETAPFPVSGATSALSATAERRLQSTLTVADTTFNESTIAYTSAHAPGNRDLYVYVRCWIAGYTEYVYSEFDLVVSGAALIQNHPSPGTLWWLNPGPGDCVATAGYFRGALFNLAGYVLLTNETGFHVAY